MGEHEFKTFLRSRSWNENQSKKFVDHALDDPDLPDAKSWEELEAYLARAMRVLSRKQNISGTNSIWPTLAARRADNA